MRSAVRVVVFQNGENISRWNYCHRILSPPIRRDGFSLCVCNFKLLLLFKNITVAFSATFPKLNLTRIHKLLLLHNKPVCKCLDACSISQLWPKKSYDGELNKEGQCRVVDSNFVHQISLLKISRTRERIKSIGVGWGWALCQDSTSSPRQIPSFPVYHPRTFKVSEQTHTQATTRSLRRWLWDTAWPNAVVWHWLLIPKVGHTETKIDPKNLPMKRLTEVQIKRRQTREGRRQTHRSRHK